MLPYLMPSNFQQYFSHGRCLFLIKKIVFHLVEDLLLKLSVLNKRNLVSVGGLIVEVGRSRENPVQIHLSHRRCLHNSHSAKSTSQSIVKNQRKERYRCCQKKTERNLSSSSSSSFPTRLYFFYLISNFLKNLKICHQQLVLD